MNLSIIVLPGGYNPEGHFCMRENVSIREVSQELRIDARPDV